MTSQIVVLDADGKEIDWITPFEDYYYLYTQRDGVNFAEYLVVQTYAHQYVIPIPPDAWVDIRDVDQ